MRIAALLITAYVAESNSLKDKRSVIKQWQARLRKEYGASVCEEAYQNHRKWMGLGVALACADETIAHQRIQKIEQILYEDERLSRLDIVEKIY
ncbi:MAG: DUF503 family protein [Christensenellales bacterium]|jgi:uncharacterized protein YlxP (DUF503 family)